jgi:3-hydroxy-3-methylglutaryl CoA synthase
MFESPHHHNPYSTSSILRHSNGTRTTLHEDHDTILTNDFDHQAFHQPNTRKVTKIIPSMFRRRKKKHENQI